MKRVVIAGMLCASALGAALAATGQPAQSARPPARTQATPSRPPMAVAHEPAPPSAEAQAPVLKQYCAGCHNDRSKAGGLTLTAFDAARPDESPEVAEKIIRKVRAGMMPPPGARRPDASTLTALATSLETRIDAAAALRPNPGWRPFQRLNRAEYARAVRDVLNLDVDVSSLLPPDTIGHGFDNISEEQGFSPTLMEAYLRAASTISRLAVGDRSSAPTSALYKVPRTGSQMRHVEGAPVGTRGGISLVHIFPADGQYVFKMLLHGGPTGDLFGTPAQGEQIELSINGEQVALLSINPEMKESDQPNGLTLHTPPIHVKAGPQRVSAAFIQTADGPIDDLIAPIEQTLADTNVGETYGITALPHLRDFAITGPHQVTGVSDTPSRRAIFTCRPTSAREEETCAAQIVKRLAGRGYRGHVTAEDLQELTAFYEQGRKAGDFESGVRMAVQGMLAHPRFVFRLEQTPAAAKAGQPYRIDDLDLASRLSFFLWGTVPDATLVNAAAEGLLATPAGVQKQVRRMLADPRSSALATRFAAQWFRLQDVGKTRPDPLLFPQWDQTLTDSLVRETELFFDSLVREDRAVLDLITADYTFVNERIAQHYGIANVMGSNFRRVQIPDPHRRGILGHGSILLLTSVADRTSPVLRGKWVMEVLLGTPPPPPPPNVPDLDDTSGVKDARPLSVRERLEEHRRNPACTSCHRVMDPLGLALENFDATGAWRIKDNGVTVDPTGELYDGTPMDGPDALRQALLKRPEVLLRNFTENLMTYALGRPIEAYDMPTVRAIVRDAGRNGNRMSSFVLGVVNSAAFRMSKAEPLVSTAEQR